MAYAYLVVFEIQPHQLKASYSGKIPLHATLMLWFFSVKTLGEIIKLIRRVVASREKIQTKVKDRTLYGHGEDKPVALLEKTAELENLHMKLFNELGKYGTNWLDESFVGEGYNPHITVEDADSFKKGGVIELHTIAVIQAENLKDIEQGKMIIERIELK